MFRTFLRITFRNLFRQKGHSLINILGLAIGIACSILIILFVSYELGYDKYNKHHDRIFRIAVDGLAGNTAIYQTYTPAPLPAALLKEFPEIENVTRISRWNEVKTRYQDNVFSEDQIFLVDSSFLEIFSFNMVKGDMETALAEPFSIVLTESMVTKYFADEDPINKVMQFDTLHFKVTGVIEDVPDQSHFHFDFLIPLTSIDGLYNGTTWWWNEFNTYLMINRETDYRDLEAKFPDFVKKYLFEGKDYDELVKSGNKWEYYLQPLTDIHLNSDIAGEFEPNGNETYIYIFWVVAVFILVMACINFMNLTTAKSTRRAREVGVRKVCGATKSRLIFQFISESILISIISLVIGLLLVELLLPSFRDFTGRNLSIHYFDNLWIHPALLFLAVIIGLLSGSYPAFVLSSYNPISVLKGKRVSGSKGIALKDLLVVLQFTISIFLIIGTLTVYSQLRMIQTKDVGFKKQNTIVIKNAYLLEDKAKTFKKELRQVPNILHVAGSHRLPGMRLNNIGFGAEGFEGGFTLNLICCDPEYTDVLGFEMTHGRFFSNEFKTDTSAIIINEAALKLIGWEGDPIGKKLNTWGDPPAHFNLVGIVKDFHYESMHEKVRPQAFLFLGGSYSYDERFITVRCLPGTESEVLEALEGKWNEFSMELPFTYSFLSADYDSLYKNEQQTKDMMIIFTFLAIFIACLGLLGLASYMAAQKTKEIGIRKTYGASSRNIVWSFSKEFSKLVIAANILAWPIAWYAMDNWLQSFEYRVNMKWWIFILASVSAFVIAWLTVSYQSYKASRTNPVDAIKYE